MLKNVILGTTLTFVAIIVSVKDTSAGIASNSWQTGKVLSQVGGECVAYALAGFLEAYPNPILQHPSPEWIYFGAKARDGLTIPYGNGTTLEAGVQYLEDEGYVKSAKFTENVVEMQNWILENGPIVIEAAWPSEMGSPDATGLAVPDGKYPTQHAYYCYAWNEATQSFWCQNEWGVSYGIDGKFRITEAGMEKLVSIYLHAALIVKNTL